MKKLSILVALTLAMLAVPTAALADSYTWSDATPPTLAEGGPHTVTISGTPSGTLNVPANTAVTITGTVTDSGNLTISTNANSKITWQANLSGAVAGEEGTHGLLTLQNSSPANSFEMVGGSIINDGSAAAIYSIGVPVTIAGGSVSNTCLTGSVSGTGEWWYAGIATVGNVPVTVQAGGLNYSSGMVMSVLRYAIHTGGSVTLKSGFVGGAGILLSNERIIFPDPDMSAGTAVVCHWNAKNGYREYETNSSRDLTTRYGGGGTGYAVWGEQGGMPGVIFRNGGHSGFFSVDLVTLTPDVHSPVISSASIIIPTDNGGALRFTMSERTGTYYYLVYPDADAAPDAATVRAQGAAAAKATAASVYGTYTYPAFSGLEPGTAYKLYLVVSDPAGNVSAVESVAFTTTGQAPGIDISTLNITMTHYEEYRYNGTAHKPEPEIRFDGEPVVKGTHYTITSYANNIDAGIADMVITGTGDYAGTKTLQFVIGKATPSAALFDYPSFPITAEWDGDPHPVAVTAKAGVTGLGTFSVLYQKLPDGTQTDTPPTDTGKYEVSAQLSEGQNYNSGVPVFGTMTITVPPPTVTLSGNCGDPAVNGGAEAGFILYSDGTLAITGAGAIADYQYNTDVPWAAHSSLIKTVTIGSGVTAIGDNVFAYCTMTAIDIPASVQRIGVYAFAECNSLTGVTIPDGVTAIGDYTFHGCNDLTSVTLPARLKSIGEQAFATCPELATIDLPSGLTGIGAYAFQGSGLTAIDIPNGVQTIGDNAFSYCDDLASVTLGSGVTLIDDSAFTNCPLLTTIDIPNSVQRIGASAFMDCDNLASVTLGSGIKTLGGNAFGGCIDLTDITFRGMSAPSGPADTFIGVPSGGTVHYPSGASGYTGAWLYAMGFSGGWTLDPPEPKPEPKPKPEPEPAPVITITTQPAVSTAFVEGGISGILTVEASATKDAELSYQWYSAATDANTDGTAIEGADSAEFTIPTDLVAGTYYYYCVVGAEGATPVSSDVAAVTVVPAPVVPVFLGLAGDYVAGGTAVPLRMAGKGSEHLTVIRVNGAAATEFDPTEAGNYLIEASSADGKLRIWKYVTVK